MDRRQFLNGSSAAVAASLFVSGNEVYSSEVKVRHTMDTTESLKGKIFKSFKGGGVGKDLDSMIARLKATKELGFDGIETQTGNLKNPTALREAVQKTGIPCHGVVDGIHWKHRLSSPDEKTRDIGREGLIEAITQCHTIGGSAVLLVPGRVSGAEETHQNVWDRSIVEVRKVLPLCARLGVPVLIENVWNGFCETPEEFRDYIDAFNSPWIGAYFDIGNVRKFGKPEDWIRMLGKRVMKLDMKDWGAKNGFCRLGEGDVDFPEVCNALREIGYTGWCTREGADKNLEDTSKLMDDLLELT